VEVKLPVIKGKVTVTKIYSDGVREKVLEEPNTVLRGFGYLITKMLVGAASQSKENFDFRYFQAGTGNALANIPNHTGEGPYDRFTVWGLQSPLSKADYGTEPNIPIKKLNPVSGHPEFYYTSTTSFTTSTSLYFGDIGTHISTSYDGDYIIASIVLDETVANGKTIKEIGLFAKNPDNTPVKDNPILIAYKVFGPNQVIDKNSDFSLDIQWEIKLVDTSLLPEGSI
jgi:hypothetical protein